MKIRIKEYDEDGKTRKSWWADITFARSEVPPTICVDYAQKGAKTRRVAVYIPISKIHRLVEESFNSGR